jgi:SAM-dependent methyltransferase
MWLDDLLLQQPVKREGNNLVFAGDGSADWARRQEESVERYTDEHYEEDPRAARMYGNFIATGLPDRKAVVLDIGAGLSAELPHYVEELGLERYVALEPLTEPVERSYPCLVGALAERIPLKDDSVDAVLFGTSLDHIENEDTAIEEVRRVLKPHGKLFFWQGLYEPEMVAREKSFERVFFEKHPLKRIARIVGAPIEYAVLARRIVKRRRQLKSGEPIDSMHFRWYTRDRMKDSIARWGLTAARALEPPGVACIYIEATPAG